LENLEGSIFAWLFGRLVICHTYDILMLLWLLKMLSLNFFNVLDWTWLDFGTMVDLPDAMLDLPDTMVDFLTPR
jgi:hypothetical protein